MCCYHENRLLFEYVVIYRVLLTIHTNHAHTYDGSLNFSSKSREERVSEFLSSFIEIIVNNDEEKFVYKWHEISME